MKGSNELAKELLAKIFTSGTLKLISTTLEKLTQNKGFKIHTNEIIGDETLTDQQKRNQLLYIIKSLENPILYDFFSDTLADNSFWLFSSGQINYFEHFVKEFQTLIQDVKVIKLSTAIPLSPEDLKAIANNFTKWYGSKTIIHHEVNGAIVGGAQIQIENLVFDYSIRSKFRHFTKEWLKSVGETQTTLGFHDSF
ncbi:hypothetical protein A3B57_01400 [Microgenomates group bacterium RIFCSPLOWO2_01_FULL_47_10]|nr:MAG: hypothetical protein A3B57_01400 [Microgenomates group bacterium RIFCSPLOWO2_01_FULL_47_10]